MSLDQSDTVKALELYWNHKKDSIFYSVNLSNSNEPETKRSILSECSKLFDPLGLLGPVVVVGKILIQQLWKYQLNWGDPIPVEAEKVWLDYKNQLISLQDIECNMCITLAKSRELQWHGFSDAGRKAYGACLYLRVTDDKYKHYSSLFCSKSRVTPLKTTTLHRLQLCDADLLSTLCDTNARALKLEFSKTLLWSDSTIVLNWIQTPPHTLKTFVANRVSQIQSKTQVSSCRHVRSQDNPADFISRGQNAIDFAKNSLWVQGPSWLSENEETCPYHEFRSQTIIENLETKPILSLKITQADFPMLTKFDNMKTLKNVVAYCQRFISNLKLKNKK